uniref:Uncharacterized protein n=1 Tax=Chromera velia CCMP2878 TaxID=1169474 RepID=A0A0G4HH79_9ALVE|eukprot:Cvel_27393.t1-p1 / transcript=Cvel_27393.t1 / gene=Cvel_27393 / organism=Chromera_velia_CCMP2878 / gene_product=hypothetical protein / transcript_product=hypothetical protein / location=Cvel_scaffold3411:10202-16489(-) / protein_length=797 / sequence_SO=supercontig / SO=protein_coding / is_pseudo=false
MSNSVRRTSFALSVLSDGSAEEGDLAVADPAGAPQNAAAGKRHSSEPLNRLSVAIPSRMPADFVEFTIRWAIVTCHHLTENDELIRSAENCNDLDELLLTAQRLLRPKDSRYSCSRGNNFNVSMGRRTSLAGLYKRSPRATDRGKMSSNSLRRRRSSVTFPVRDKRNSIVDSLPASGPQSEDEETPLTSEIGRKRRAGECATHVGRRDALPTGSAWRPLTRQELLLSARARRALTAGREGSAETRGMLRRISSAESFDSLGSEPEHLSLSNRNRKKRSLSHSVEIKKNENLSDSMTKTKRAWAGSSVRESASEVRVPMTCGYEKQETVVCPRYLFRRLISAVGRESGFPFDSDVLAHWFAFLATKTRRTTRALTDEALRVLEVPPWVLRSSQIVRVLVPLKDTFGSVYKVRPDRYQLTESRIGRGGVPVTLALWARLVGPVAGREDVKLRPRRGPDGEHVLDKSRGLDMVRSSAGSSGDSESGGFFNLSGSRSGTPFGTEPDGLPVTRRWEVAESIEASEGGSVEEIEEDIQFFDEEAEGDAGRDPAHLQSLSVQEVLEGEDSEALSDLESEGEGRGTGERSLKSFDPEAYRKFGTNNPQKCANVCARFLFSGFCLFLSTQSDEAALLSKFGNLIQAANEIAGADPLLSSSSESSEGKGEKEKAEGDGVRGSEGEKRGTERDEGGGDEGRKSERDWEQIDEPCRENMKTPPQESEVLRNDERPQDAAGVADLDFKNRRQPDGVEVQPASVNPSWLGAPGSPVGGDVLSDPSHSLNASRRGRDALSAESLSPPATPRE